MQRFIDETIIEVYSGSGGDGKVAFRREKYVPKGGPNGGDGGRGGAVVFVVRNNLKTLAHLRFKRVFRAQDGQGGLSKNMHGRNGDDVEIPVPPGCLLRDPETGELIKDLSEVEDRWVYLTGGNGGFGNARFATARRQTPRFAIPGKPGVAQTLKVELKLIADIGFVGLPNAGKSSLLAALTNARPKIAPYPFTTKIPNLGVMSTGYRDVILADIPGIIEGASGGAGLGFRFLRHISRSFGLAYLIDLSDPGYLDALDVLRNELELFESALLEKQSLIIGTKLDLEDTAGRLTELAEKYPDTRVFGISVFSGQGIAELREEFLRMSGPGEEEGAEGSAPGAGAAGEARLPDRDTSADDDDLADDDDPAGEGAS